MFRYFSENFVKRKKTWNNFKTVKVEGNINCCCFFIYLKLCVSNSSWKVCQTRPRTLFKHIFFCYLAAARLTLVYCRWESLANQMLITAFTYRDPKVTGSLITRFVSQSLANYLAWLKFWLIINGQIKKSVWYLVTVIHFWW